MLIADRLDYCPLTMIFAVITNLVIAISDQRYFIRKLEISTTVSLSISLSTRHAINLREYESFICLISSPSLLGAFGNHLDSSNRGMDDVQGSPRTH